MVAAPGSAAAAVSTAVASEDARVVESSPTSNYGTSDHLKTEGGSDPDTDSYLKFSVGEASGLVQSAVLRVFAYNDTQDGPAVYQTSTSWNESAITWGNRPLPTSGALADKGAIATGSWVEYNVTAAVTGNGTYGFVLRSPSSDSVNFYSSEGTNPPQLVVTTTTTSSPSPSPTASASKSPTSSPSPSPTRSTSPSPSPSPTPSPTTVTSTTAAIEDTRAAEANPSSNYGSSTSLKTEGGADPDIHSYVKFLVDGVAGSVQTATLRVYAYNDTRDGPAVYRTSTSWSEGTLNWSNRPAPTTGALADKGSISTGTWVEYDVRSVVSGNGSYSFVLQTSSTDAVSFYSSEGTHPPQLVIRSASTVSGTEVKIAAAGDIACNPDDAGFNGGLGTATRCRMKYTSDLLLDKGYAGVLVLGDAQYNSGTTSEFMASYDPTWGRVKSITYPAVGNHEYGTSGASGYFNYFGARAGDPSKGYYSFDLGGWHFVAINSNCTKVSGGCAIGSPQYHWLASDLASNTEPCTVVFTHHPRYSSGHDGDATFIADMYNLMYDEGVEVLLAGHSHNYERFAPQGKTSNLDESRGIREFVVGTGGAFFTGIGTVKPNSVVRQNTTFGILELSLRTDGYSWRFVPEAGKTFTDTGSSTCH